MPDPQTPPDSAEQVCRDLPVMMNRCMSVGLFATGQLMHEVVRKAGWELADIKAEEKKISVRRRYAKHR